MSDVKSRPRLRRVLPWLSIIQFHKEVTRRAEEAFFALPTGKTDSERWSSLVGFAPQSLAGPWELDPGMLVSERLALAVRSGDATDLFLGCACWFRWHRVERGWYVDWLPALYRQVEIAEAEEGGMVLQPVSGVWEVSPLLFGLLDRKGAVPKRPLEEWLPELLEAANERKERLDGDLDAALRDTLGREIPELGEEFAKPFPADKVKMPPTAWILFTPPATASVFNRHLMADYEELERRFQGKSETLGGLALLEDVTPPESDKSGELLPIVALNASQQGAVSEILDGRPVSVVSGPPGCGKSQVVVSVLLNAWARGSSVLFASNNNKAVDVVRERVERFESDFPIAIRAGARSASNLEEALRRALNVVAGVKPGASSATPTVEKQRRLLEQKRITQGFLESQVPQRVDEALRSALNAYGEYQSAVRALESAKSRIRQQLRDLGYEFPVDQFGAVFVQPFASWMREIEGIRLAISQAEQERSRLRGEIAAARAKRDRACAAVGLDTAAVANWDWLANGPGPEWLAAWLDQLRESLTQVVERSLARFTWQEEFDRWRGSEEARDWTVAVRALATDVRAAQGRLAPLLAEVAAAWDVLQTESATLAGLAIPESAAPSAELLTGWSALYAEHETAPKRAFDWFPWSPASRRARGLRRFEGKLRTAYPLAVWQRVGVLDLLGRARLAEVVEATRRWLEVQARWRRLEPVRSEIEGTLASLREAAGRLGLAGVPASSNLDEWRRFGTETEQQATVGETAEGAWRRREERDRVAERMRALASDYDASCSGMPLKEAWRGGAGRAFDAAVAALADDPDPAKVVALRTALYTEPVGDLLSHWGQAREAESAARELSHRASALPTEESLTVAWWGRRPEGLPRPLVAAVRLPGPDDTLVAHLRACEEWEASWRQHLEVEKPALVERVTRERAWARERLAEARSALPESAPSRSAHELVEGVLAGDDKSWPTAKLQAAFAEYSPEGLKARIEAIDAELENLSFAAARDSWVSALADDSELQETLESLLRRYERNRGRLYKEDYPIFREALRAVPIWITTAQAPQALPLLPGLFDLLVVDEATQCTPTNILPLVYRAKRVAVIGDKEQLPAIPTLTGSAEQALARNFGIEEWLELLGHAQNTVYGTFVQCLPRRNSDVVNLDEHYRSHPLIIGFANEHIYRKRLRLRKDPGQGVRVPSGPGVFCQNVEGLSERGPRDQSWLNRPEAEAVVVLIRQLRQGSQFTHFSLGVVTPFRAQVDLLSEMLDRAGLGRGVVVGTAHRFQGDEADVIIFSPVIARGITPSAAGWVESPPNLINVSVTRAREAFFLVGHLGSCRQQPGILGKLTRYIEGVETLRGTSLEELDLFSWMVVNGWSPEVHPKVGDIEVDFVLRHEGRKLAVEVDGLQHDWSQTADEARDAYLRARGYLVLRVPARAVRETPAICLEKIDAALGMRGGGVI